MPLIALIRAVRRTLDVLLVGLILLVLATLTVARGVPLLTGGATFVVGGGSMEPSIPLGAVVVATPVDAADLAVGDVVSLQVGEDRAVFTHRIVRLTSIDGEPWLETRGDANPDPDPSIVPASAVIGRVTATIPWVGYVVRLLSVPQGMAFLLAMAVVLLAAAWLLEALELDHHAARRHAVTDRALVHDAVTSEAAAG